MALIISKFRYQAAIFCTVILVILSVRNSIFITDHDYLIRGNGVVRPVWDKIIYSVPKGEVKSVFVISGEHYLRGYIFDWSGPYPYALERNIADVSDFPVFASEDMAVSLVCDPTTKIAYWGYGGGQKVAGDTTSLEKIYGWNLGSDGILEDRTETVRFGVAKKADCISKKQNIKLSRDIEISSTRFIPSLTINNDKSGLIIDWKKTDTLDYGRKYSYIAFLVNKETDELIDTQFDDLIFADGEITKQSSLVFLNRRVNLLNVGNLRLRIKDCPENCNSRDVYGFSKELVL